MAAHPEEEMFMMQSEATFDGSFPFAFIGGLCLLGAFLAGLGAGRL